MLCLYHTRARSQHKARAPRALCSAAMRCTALDARGGPQMHAWHACVLQPAQPALQPWRCCCCCSRQRMAARSGLRRRQMLGRPYRHLGGYSALCTAPRGSVSTRAPRGSVLRPSLPKACQQAVQRPPRDRVSTRVPRGSVLGSQGSSDAIARVGWLLKGSVHIDDGVKGHPKGPKSSHTVTRDEAQLGPVLQKHVGRSLLRVDADSVCMAAPYMSRQRTSDRKHQL